MKSNIGNFLLCMLSTAFLCNCTQTSIVKESEEQPEIGQPTTYGVVETTDFSLPSGCHWVYTLSAGKSADLTCINSSEELAKSVSCGEMTPSVDFNTYSLLLAYGDTIRKVQKLTYQLVQVAENEYRLEVTIQSARDEAWPGGWTLAALIPKIPQNTVIRLNEEQISGNPDEPPVVSENPYREDVSEYWKLLLSITGDDSLDCSADNIIYEFCADGKLTVTGNLPGDLAEGEHTYIYRQPNVCPTCSPAPNMQIDNENRIYCLALSKENKMTIATEQGSTLRWSKTFVKVDITNNQNENCIWNVIEPIVLTEDLEMRLNNVFSPQNELVENITGDTIMFVINNEQDFLKICNDRKTRSGIDFEKVSILWGRVLSSSVSDKIVQKHLFKCSEYTSYKYDVTIEKCVDCWTALGNLYFWGIYPKGADNKIILLIVK